MRSSASRRAASISTGLAGGASSSPANLAAINRITANWIIASACAVLRSWSRAKRLHLVNQPKVLSTTYRRGST